MFASSSSSSSSHHGARRNSAQYSERQPLAMIDTDTNDFLDGDVPPPHRLSSHFSGSPFPSHPSFDTAPLAPYSTPSFDLDRPRSAMQSSSSYHLSPHDGSINAGMDERYSYNNQGMSNSYSNSYSNNYSNSYYEQDAWSAAPKDEDAFLAMSKSSSATNLSPEAFARERYINRMEANEKAAAAASSPYYDQNGIPSYGVKSGGMFAGKRKWWWIGGIVVLLAIGGAVAGVLISKSLQKDSATGVVKSDKSDPSNFEKDPALSQSFYAMCYTPQDAQYDLGCKASIDAVIEDVQLMSQLTTRLRLYGADCGIPSLVLEAIEKTKVNMTVYLATWLPQPDSTDANSTYQRQVSELTSAIKQYGVDHVDGVSVGNEYLLNGGSEDDLIAQMADMRTTLQGLNLPKTIPVGTADAGSMITKTLAAGSDYVMANVHPWFGEVPIDQAAGWVWSYTANQEPASALEASNSPELFIAETGWPSGANATQFETLGAAQAGISELNTFLADYVCQANANITAGDKFSKYFFFEFSDETWKDAMYGGVEAHWGLFNANRTLKAGLTLPNCTHP